MNLRAIVAIVVLTSVACGKPKEEPQAETAQKSAEQAQKGAPSEGNVKPVDPVSLRDLIALLPAPSGWQREKPAGERTTSPVTFTDVSVRLMKGDATVTAKITDSALNQVLLSPYATYLTGNYEHKTDHGYEKAIKVGDAPAFEKWDSGTRSGNLAVIVGGRFIVEIDGSSIDDPKVLHDVLDKTDLKKLAAMQ
jgi:hypothetical protein